MTEVYVVRVFTNEAGEYGNPLGVMLDTAKVPAAERQAIATRLNFSETVFVDDVATARLHIHTPALEIPLAGHPLVGSAWFLAQDTRSEVTVLRPVLAGEVEAWQDAGLSWVRASIAEAPDWQFVQLSSVS
jgi:PhzF family phenazine biosynthesis protein